MVIVHDWGELVPPQRLSQSILIHVNFKEERLYVLCSRCHFITLQKSDQEGFREPCECLHLYGAPVPDPTRIPTGLTVVEVILPCRYVTYITLGEEFRDRYYERTDHVLVIAPLFPGPATPMSPAAIQATLSELLAPEY